MIIVFGNVIAAQAIYVRPESSVFITITLSPVLEEICNDDMSA